MSKAQNLISSELCIVPETLQDADDIYECMGCDPEITRYTGWNPYQTFEATVDRIERDICSEDGSYSWVIKKDGEFIGTIGAYDYQSEDMSIEIGYSIARKFWGRGYGRTTVDAVVSFLLNEPHIKVIRAWSHVDNAASIKILQRSGFVETGKDGMQITFELNPDKGDK